MVADCLNFTKAANHFKDYTASCVSHQIRALEDELGVKLFIRIPISAFLLTKEGM